MSRWKPDAEGRLTKAAITLFDEQGYDATTVAEIAAAAGLTKRTFFRYFSDKREVLFNGSHELQERWIGGIESAPSQASPMAAVSAGRKSAEARLLLAVTLFSLAITTQALQRVDQVHLPFAAFLSLGLLPVSLAVLLGRWPGWRTGSWPTLAVSAVGRVPALLAELARQGVAHRRAESHRHRSPRRTRRPRLGTAPD